MNCTTTRSEANRDERRRRTARQLARQLCRGFRCHDRGDREGAVEAFFEVDRRQFSHLDRHDARLSAKAYVDALWAKDEVEGPYAASGAIVDRDGIAEADWRPVFAPLSRRATVVGMVEEYARATTAAWREHKANGDYWTPTLRAQRIEVQAAIDDPLYPRKRSDGRSGHGSLAARYLVGVECHDMHSAHYWERAVTTLTGYFEEILRLQEGGQ